MWDDSNGPVGNAYGSLRRRRLGAVLCLLADLCGAGTAAGQ
mgnify:CR=1 FL=1